MHYLSNYQTHHAINELNASVKAHITHAQLTGNARLVLQCLAKHSIKYVGACRLKAITIANELNISRSTVTRVIKQLKERGIIEVHTGTKLNGIKGANIYVITPFSHREPSNEPTGVTHRADAAKPCSCKTKRQKSSAECFSFNLFFNHFVNNNVVAPTTKQVLYSIYQPTTPEQQQAFEELCKIAFGRLKQLMRSHHIPYLQMEQIIIRCMQQLVKKQGVRNQFAMYSKMIERQALQLFEQPIQPRAGRREVVPEWFYTRYLVGEESWEGDVDFEVRRAKVLGKLGELGK